MPIYEYIAENTEDPEQCCRVCAKGFELYRPVDRQELEKCPICRQAVRKVISRVSAPHVANSDSVSAAKRAGYTVLERRDVGVYEKM